MPKNNRKQLRELLQACGLSDKPMTRSKIARMKHDARKSMIGIRTTNKSKLYAAFADVPDIADVEIKWGKG
jgi:hypothetical protein